MGQRKVRSTLGLEECEARSLLSGATLTTHTYNLVVANVHRTVANLIRTHDINQATASLNQLAAMIPSGSKDLAPIWQRDLANYNPTARGSSIAITRQLLNDLKQDVVEGVKLGEITVTGPDARLFNRLAHRPGAPGTPGAPRPQVSADSVNIANNTGISITVTANLVGTTQNITKTIRGQGPVLFNFQSNTGNYIKVTIEPTTGSTPPTYTTTLNRPIGGYYGTLYTVSIFSGYFSVSQ